LTEIPLFRQLWRRRLISPAHLAITPSRRAGIASPSRASLSIQPAQIVLASFQATLTAESRPSGMVRFRDYYPPPWLYEEHHDRIVVRDGYGMKLLTMQFLDMEQPGKRGAKFQQLTKAQARSLALAVVRLGNSSKS
jgi:hypothetical protein